MKLLFLAALASFSAVVTNGHMLKSSEVLERDNAAAEIAISAHGTTEDLRCSSERSDYAQYEPQDRLVASDYNPVWRACRGKIPGKATKCSYSEPGKPHTMLSGSCTIKYDRDLSRADYVTCTCEKEVTIAPCVNEEQHPCHQHSSSSRCTISQAQGVCVLEPTQANPNYCECELNPTRNV